MLVFREIMFETFHTKAMYMDIQPMLSPVHVRLNHWHRHGLCNNITNNITEPIYKGYALPTPSCVLIWPSGT
ncbi:hypothetical protein AAFF_G00086680 [Aldrovandia affinis]|uniref:Uncharacterized protein n=1 Tax=Aldrovandia affinis TaxID=143900 RepID=A0AAD7RWM1_9TELE|nr:hypothetical protein AAFF_G00086680 [Aldrovandia affinis]